MKNKQELRHEIKQLLQSIDQQTYEGWSNEIANKVFLLPEWKEAKTIGITISGKREVDTIHIIKAAWESNKHVAVPKCDPKTKTMTFREIRDFSVLEVVYYGLKEPIINKTKKVNTDEIDLLFVPGLYFTKEGYRLGHGGGYYDRFLENYNGQTISIAFDIQITKNIPIENFDIPVKKIVTNKQVVECNG